MSVTTFTDPATEGDEFTFTFTLAGSGTISGATLTASIRPIGQVTNIISAHAVTITDAANRICTLTLTEAESALLVGAPSYDPRKTFTFAGDVKMVLGGVTTHFGPFVFPMRVAVTA